MSNEPPHPSSNGVHADVAPEELIRRPAPEKWSIAARDRSAPGGRGAGDGLAIAETCWRIQAWP